MHTEQIVKNSAAVVTITHLSPGDVYKRIETPSYSAEPVLRYGIVQDVMNNGEDAAVTALEYESDYSAGAKATVKVFDGVKPAALYPATPEEVQAHLDALELSAFAAVDRAREELGKREAAVNAVARLRDQVGSLTAPATADALPAAPAPVDAEVVEPEPGL